VHWVHWIARYLFHGVGCFCSAVFLPASLPVFVPTWRPLACFLRLEWQVNEEGYAGWVVGAYPLAPSLRITSRLECAGRSTGKGGASFSMWLVRLDRLAAFV
jgi:hypothetical protein